MKLSSTKHFLLVILLFQSVLAYSQITNTSSVDSINYIDENGLKQGYWEEYQKVVLLSWYDGLGSKEGCQYGEDAYFRLLAHGNYKNNKKTGAWHFFYYVGVHQKIEKVITYFDDESISEYNYDYNYLIVFSTDSSEITGQLFLSRDTVDVNCKNSECAITYMKKNVLTSFTGIQHLQYEIERTAAGIYDRAIYKIKNGD